MKTSRHRQGFFGRGATLAAAAGALALFNHCVADLDDLDSGAGAAAGGGSGGGAGAGRAGSGGSPGPAGTGGTGNVAGTGGGPAGGGGGAAGVGGAGGGGYVPVAPKYDAESSKWCDAAKAQVPDLEFCADFDTLPSGPGTALGAIGAVEATGGSRIDLTSEPHASKWNSLFVHAPSAPTFGTFNAKVTRRFVGTLTSKFTLTFDFLPEQVTTVPGTAALVGAVEFLKGSTKYSLRLVSFEGKLQFEESRLDPTFEDNKHPETLFQLDASTWTRIQLEVVLDTVGGGSGGEGGQGTPPQARVSKGPGGGPPGAGGLTTVGVATLNVPVGAVRQDPDFIMGVPFATMPHQGWLLRYDNVMLDLDVSAE